MQKTAEFYSEAQTIKGLSESACVQWTVVVLWFWSAKTASKDLRFDFQKEAICSSSSRVWKQASFLMAS